MLNVKSEFPSLIASHPTAIRTLMLKEMVRQKEGDFGSG
jgi:hypothetical protein